MTKKIVLSLKPRFWELMKSGEKIVELRNVFPRHPDDAIYIYASSPIQKIVGIIEQYDVEKIYQDSVPYHHLFRRICITREEYEKYTQHRASVFLIIIQKLKVIEPFDPSVKWSWWTKPPMNYRFIPPTFDVF